MALWSQRLRVDGPIPKIGRIVIRLSHAGGIISARIPQKHMSGIINRLVADLLIDGLVMTGGRTGAKSRPLVPGRSANGAFGVQALANRPVEFHENKPAALVSRETASLLVGDNILAFERPQPDSDAPAPFTLVKTLQTIFRRSPAAVLEYLYAVAGSVRSNKNALRRQLLKDDASDIEHGQEDDYDLASHLVIGPNGLWVHGHLLSGSGNGTLIQVERQETGAWKARNVLLERSTERKYGHYPPCFYAVNSITRSRARREALFSTAQPLVDLYQDILERAWNGDPDVPISFSMGQGVTPGTEEGWVMEPLENWDAESGLWMQERNGWVFLQAGNRPENLRPIDHAIFILRTWAKTLDPETSRLFQIPFQPIPTPIDETNRPALIAWTQSTTIAGVLHRDRGDGLRTTRFIISQELAYVRFLLEYAPPSRQQRRGRLRTSA